MTAVAERMNPPATVEQHPATDSAALIQVISRAASDPNVDIDKMERLMQMHERLTERSAKAAFAAALAEMQPKLPVIERKGLIKVPAKDGKTGHETPYALWEDINDKIKPFLADHGFALSFRIKKDADRVEVTGVLSHREGHSEETTLSLPMDTTGSKNNVQAIGSSTSYGKRYTAMALLNITTRGEDDDGKAAGLGQTISDEQLKELQTLADDVGGDIVKLCTHFHIEQLPDLPKGKFAEAIGIMELKRRKAAK
jgi:hypothetical protein